MFYLVSLSNCFAVICLSSSSCQFATMAALLLSRKKLPKLIRNNIKFTKSYSSTISKVFINGPQLNLGWRHCAVASNHRVIFYFLNLFVWLFFWISRTFFWKVCCSTLFVFVVGLFLKTQCRCWVRHGEKCVGSRVGKQTKNWKNTCW